MIKQAHTIVFVDKISLTQNHIGRLNRLGKVKLTQSAWPTKKEILQSVKDATILVSKWIYIGKDIMRAAPHLQYIVMAMTGYHTWIDIKEAKKRKILVSNVPEFSSESVAEHAILLLLAVARKLFQAQESLVKGEFDPKKHQGMELAGKTIGIIGYGNIGKRIGEIAKGFKMYVLPVDSKTPQKELRAVLTKSHVISLNVPLIPQTVKMIGEEELSYLPQGAIVINTSRGKVIDERALVKHLKNGHLGGAGLDVFEKEPTDKNNPLFQLPNVVVTPHIAWNTQESRARLLEGVVGNIEAFMKGTPINLIT